MKRSLRSSFVAARSHSIVVLAISFSLAPWPTWALDFDPGDLVYEEDFDGESVYPTTPEIDTLGFGGGTGTTFPAAGGEIPGGPSLNGSVARAFVESGLDQTKSFDVAHSALGDARIGVRAGFENLLGPASHPDVTLAQVVIEFDTAAPLEIIFTANVALQPQPSGDLGGVFFLEEFDRGSASSIQRTDIGLSTSEAEAIATGSPFVVDLEIDRDTETVSASLDVDGVEVALIGSLPVISLSAGIGAIETHVAMTSILGGFSHVDIDPVTIYSDATMDPLTFTVDSFVDEADSSVGDGLCETSTGVCSLRAATEEANATTAHDTIILPAEPTCSMDSRMRSN